MLTKETRATFWWLLFIVITGVLTSLFLYPRYKKLQQDQAELKILRERLSDKKRENEQLRKRVNDLQNSPQAVERVAREKYRKARSGEIVLTYPVPEKDKEK